MADYFQVKNQNIFNPPANTSLGNATNQFNDVYVENDLVLGNVTVTGSTIIAPRITSIAYPGNDTAADTAGGQTITLTGSGFVAGASVLINGSAVGVVSVVSSTSITFTSPANTTGSYVIYVINPDGSTAIAIPGIQYSGTPTWTTAAGTLGNVYETVGFNQSVTATGDAPITYSVFTGSIPPGSTFNANGTITGTSQATESPTTYSFTVRATDAEQQDTNRAFSISVIPDVVTWSSPANNTTYTQSANTAIANIALSATSAAGFGIVYTANTLPTGVSINGANIIGTPTVAANSSSLLTATANSSNKTNTQVINWVVTSTVSVNYLVVAGGGGGAGVLSPEENAGGAGAGGFRTSAGSSGGGGSAESAINAVPGTNYTVTVGAGGAAGGAGGASGVQGSNSVFSTITSIGGGFAEFSTSAGSVGGSGGSGGAPGGYGTQTAGSGTANQGYNSGAGASYGLPYYGTAGGGGAGGVGGNGTTSAGGAGGVGVASTITGSSVYYAGGGGGATYGGGTPGTGGNGGGGNGGIGGTATQATPGTTNTGGGAGGSGTLNGSPNAGKTGGSGIVVLKYSDNYGITVGAGLTSSTSSPAGGYKITTFTAGTGTVSFSIPTVPGAPTIGSATAISATTASVAFTAPASDGASTITTYTATSSPGNITGTLSQSGSGTITVTGLTTGTSYTFTVTATNSIGTSSPSASSNSITPVNLYMDYLIVAGGGGGSGGGGGAGGMLTGTTIFSGAYTLTVGAGGAGNTQGSASASSGTNSLITGLTAIGGGGGGGVYAVTNGLSGGSGGGGSIGTSSTASVATGGTATSGQGYAGGTATNTGTYQGWIAGGGGGAGGVGESVTNRNTGTAPGGGMGGAGVASSITGSAVTYAAGAQAYWSNTVSGDATANTGNGGGGSRTTEAVSAGWNGGSGVVVIAYPDTYPAISSIGGGLSYTQPSRAGYRVYRFTAGTGTITF